MAEPRTHELDLKKLLPGPHYCSACARRVCEAVAGLDGVAAAGCDLESGTLTITRYGRGLSAEALAAKVRRIALEETGRVAHAAYRVTGLD